MSRPGLPESVEQAFRNWLDAADDGEASKAASASVINAISEIKYKGNSLLEEIMEKKDYLVKKSFWIIGGDGWAYDIGYGESITFLRRAATSTSL